MVLTIQKITATRFEFSLNGGTPISDNAPNLTTNGNYCHFKTANGASIVGKQDILYSDITVADTYGGTGNFTFSDTAELWTKLIALDFFNGVASGGGGGSTTFQALLDTPSYSGNDGKIVVINESELRLDATTFYNYNQFSQLDDVSIGSLIEGKIVEVVDTGGGVLKFALTDKPAEGTTYFSAVGGFDYNDLATATTPLAYATGDLQLTNDTLGAYTFLSQPPYGITQAWNPTTNTFDFSQLSVGDEVFLRIKLKITTSAANQTSSLKLRLLEGLAGEYDEVIDDEIYYKTADEHTISRSHNLYIGSNDMKNTPVKLLFSSDASADLEIVGWHVYIIRKSINILDVDSTTKKIKYSLTASQINNLGTTPIDIIPAPGVGKIIEVVRAYAKLNWGSVAFNANYMYLGNTIITDEANNSIYSEFLASTADKIKQISNYNSINSITVENAPLKLLGTDSVAVGDSTVDIYVTYTITTL